jgi:hypothetical protein
MMRRHPLPRTELDPVVVALARSVVARHHETELPWFDQVVDGFEIDPATLLDPDPLRAPVAVGVDLTLISPYVLSAAAFLGGAIGDKVLDAALDGVRDRLKRAWDRQHGKQAAPAAGGDDQQVIVVVVKAHLAELKADPAVADEVAREVVAQLLSETDGE